MVLKKRIQKTVAFAMSLSLIACAVAPMTASAKYQGKAGRTKAEAFGDDTYKNMFLSLYDDVVTNGAKNGYRDDEGIPYHAPETVIVEAPDYGHETTSEAMSYLVWVGAMHDHLTGKSGELAAAWKVQEKMIPSEQTGFMKNTAPSAQYSPEMDTPEEYPQQQSSSNTGKNPLHAEIAQAYGSDKGLYLLHWLGDVDNWYGYGSGTDFTFINTFQRGKEESCFETVPHGCIEELKFGMSGRGVKGVFSTESSVAEQWSYTNAPDAEERSIQAVYEAIRWGCDDSSVNALASKMGDELRNDMFDKYYKKIAVDTTENSPSESGYGGCHYLMSWYTSWGGAMDGAWTWQIGCSHSHMFYQNAVSAYALANDSTLKGGMKGKNAATDWEKSYDRQMEMYEWLQTPEGPFAGGCTNSWNGRYDAYPSGQATFYDMAFLVHPVYADPGSNGWIGNQVWATQRIAELYQIAVEENDSATAKRCKAMLDKWVGWFVENIQWNYTNKDTGEVMPFAIPATLKWDSNCMPDTWTGSPSANKNLTFTIENYGSSDVGCITSLANTLINYASAEGVTPNGGSELGIKAFNVGKALIDIVWDCYRDDIGVSWSEENGSLKRIFEQDVWVPKDYDGKMPNGDAIKNGIKFIDIRTQYRDDSTFNELEDYYNANGGTEGYELNYHRFWHEGDVMMAIGMMADLFPDAVPTKGYEFGQEFKNPADLTEADFNNGIHEETTTTEADVTDAPAKDTSKDTKKDDPNTDIIYGDLNGDGTADLTDLTLLSVYLMTKKAGSSIKNIKAGDVDGSGEVDIADLPRFKQYISKDANVKKLGPQ